MSELHRHLGGPRMPLPPSDNILRMPLPPSDAARLLMQLIVRRLGAAAPETVVHQAADAHLDAVKAVIKRAFDAAKASVSRTALRKAVTSGDKKAVAVALRHVPDLVRALLLKGLPRALHKVVVDGGKAGMTLLPSPRGAQLRAGAKRSDFEATDPRAIEWALEHGGDMIDGISDTTRDDIAEAIASGLEGDLDADEVVDDIIDAIGDDDRAEMIARTETMDAANEGLAASWDQAVEKGWLSPDAQKQWIAAGDDNMCDDCDGVNGETVGIDEDFSVGDDPPLHPNCRCTMGIVEADDEE